MTEQSDYNQFQFLLLQVKTMKNNLKEVDNISETTLIKEMLDATKARLEKLTTTMEKLSNNSDSYELRVTNLKN